MFSNVSENDFAICNLTIQLFTRRKSTVVVETSICFILNIAALFLNAFLCWAVYSNDRLRRVTNIYVLALAVTDLLTASLVMPFLCIVSIHGRWISSWFACQFQGYWCVVLAYTAQLMFPLTAINRYVRVLYPRIYMKLFVKKYILISIGIVSTLALCSPLPFLLRGHKFGFHPGMMICFYTIENAREKQAIYRIVFFTILTMLIWRPNLNTYHACVVIIVNGLEKKFSFSPQHLIDSLLPYSTLLEKSIEKWCSWLSRGKYLTRYIPQ